MWYDKQNDDIYLYFNTYRRPECASGEEVENYPVSVFRREFITG